jgi:hypothetical protein
MMKEFEAISKKNPVLPFERKLSKSVSNDFTKESIVEQALWLRKWLNSILGSPAHTNSIVLAEFLKPVRFIFQNRKFWKSILSALKC